MDPSFRGLAVDTVFHARLVVHSQYSGSCTQQVQRTADTDSRCRNHHYTECLYLWRQLISENEWPETLLLIRGQEEILRKEKRPGNASKSMGSCLLNILSSGLVPLACYYTRYSETLTTSRF